MFNDVEVVKETFELYELELEEVIDNLNEKFSLIRVGLANPKLLSKISVEYYGARTPLNQVASVTRPEARLLVIQAWDLSVLPLIEKAILASDLGITPQNDGKVIRLAFPELTEERRKQLVKDIKAQSESAKVLLRNKRRDINEKLKKMKNVDITEDDLKLAEKEVDKMLNTYIDKVDAVYAAKEKEILNV